MTLPDRDQWTLQVREVLACYDLPTGSLRITELGDAGGFSGARFWRVEVSSVTYCLRRWPREHPSPEKLTWIHGVLRHVAQQGLTCLPIPLKSRQATTFLTARDGHLWELAPWMPGAADYRHNPSRPKLQSALQAIGRFHRAAASLPGQVSLPGHATLPGHLGEAPTTSPGLQNRLRMLRQWTAGGGRQLAAAVAGGDSVAGGDWPELADRAQALIDIADRRAPRLADQIEQVAQLPVILQPCIRDVWHAHILFQGEEVSGIVDFGAMRRETVCGDVARLLGSLAENDQVAWRDGLDAYEQCRPLTETERRLVPLFDHTGVLLGGLNWLRWVYQEGRVFERQRVLTRVDETLARLRHLEK